MVVRLREPGAWRFRPLNGGFAVRDERRRATLPVAGEVAGYPAAPWPGWVGRKCRRSTGEGGSGLTRSERRRNLTVFSYSVAVLRVRIQAESCRISTRTEARRRPISGRGMLRILRKLLVLISPMWPRDPAAFRRSGSICPVSPGGRCRDP